MLDSDVWEVWEVNYLAISTPSGDFAVKVILNLKTGMTDTDKRRSGWCRAH